MRQSFSFSAFSGTNAVPTTGKPVLEIRRLTIAAPFDSQSFVYRTGDFSYERDPYAEFLDSPAETLAETVRNALRGSGHFADVLEPGSSLRPDLLAEITVSRLYGDFRPGSAPAAVLEIRFLFLRMRDGQAARVFFQKTYTQTVPLRRRTAASLMAGWNEALKDIVRNLTRDLGQNPIPIPG